MTKKFFIFIIALLLIVPNALLLNGCLNTTRKYEVYVTCNNSSMGNVYGSGKYEVNSEVVIVAMPNAGYEFEKWSDGNTEQVRTITVKSNYTSTATFKRVNTNTETKYVLESVEIGVYEIASKVESILLQNLYIKNEKGEFSCIDLTGASSSYYSNEDGLTLYNEDKLGYKKHYTSYDPLTIYTQRNVNNIFTDIEYVYINYETYEIFDDTVSLSGAGKSAREYVEIDPQGTTNIFDINLNNSKMTIKLNFVKI